MLGVISGMAGFLELERHMTHTYGSEPGTHTANAMATPRAPAAGGEHRNAMWGLWNHPVHRQVSKH